MHRSRHNVPTSPGSAKIWRFGFVAHQFERADQADAARLTHQRMIGQLAPAALQVRARYRSCTRSTMRFVAQDVDGGAGHRAGHRMPRVGEAVIELAAALDQRLRDAIADHDAADRQIARRHALGDRHEVRADAEVLASRTMRRCGRSRRSLRRRPAGCRSDRRSSGSRASSVAGGMMTPPAPWIGSPMKAATRSGPISRIFSSSARAATRPNSSGDRSPPSPYQYG